MSLTSQLRQAIADSGLSFYRIAKEIDVSYAVVYRFAAEQRNINLETADRLAELFGMRLTRPKRIAAKRK